MSFQQTILWTVIPRRVIAARWHFSLVVQPRLEATDGSVSSLGDYPDVLRWPTTVRRLIAGGTLALDVEAAEWSGQIHGLRRESALPDPELWAAFFPSDLPVRAWVPTDGRDAKVHSFPAADLHAGLSQIYGTVGAICTGGLPTLRHIESAHQGPKGGRGPRRRLLEELLDPWLVDGEEQSTSSKPAAQAWRFFHPYTKPDAPDPLEPSDAPKLDFHDRADALARYPSLARRLGLVIDLSVAAPPVSPAAPVLRLMLPAAPAAAAGATLTVRHLETRTACVLGPAEGQFDVAENSAGEVRGGFLRLDDGDRFEVQTVHTDGAALNLAALATTFRNTGDHPSDPERAGLPALRGEGITVLRKQRGAATKTAMEIAAKRHERFYEGTQNEPLYADDLVVGWRVDVRDEKTGAWRSLCAQTQDVCIEGPVAPAIQRFTLTDEAIVEPAATRPYTEQGPKLDELYVHEALFRWDGWSLAAERPGQLIGSSEKKNAAGAWEHRDTHPVPPTRPQGLGAATRSWCVPGSLPRLRYGRTYSLRARAVDLAGNSLPPDVGGSAGASASVPYLRWEPVAPPVVVLGNRPHEGESLERLVIRSAPGSGPNGSRVTAASYRFPEGDPNGYAYPAVSVRHIAPPKGSELLAEMHGAFDNEDRSGLRRGLDPAKPWEDIYTEAKREAEGYEGKNDDRKIPHPSGAQYLYPEPSIPVPYLPDPLAIAAELRVEDASGGAGTLVGPRIRSFYEARWPVARSFRIRLVDPADPIDEDLRSVTLAVPPGEKVRVRLRSVFPAGSFRLFGVFRWMEEQCAALARSLAETGKLTVGGVSIDDCVELDGWTPPTGAALRDIVEGEGGHEMITPTRVLELVHAVQRPVRAPKLLDLVAGTKIKILRSAGSDAVALVASVDLHAASTGRLELHATVHDHIDDPNEAEHRTTQHESIAFQLDVPERWDQLLITPDEIGGASTKALRAPRHVLGDLRHHTIRYTPVGVTRYREYFDPSLGRDPKNLTALGTGIDVIVPAAAPPSPPVVREVVPVFSWDARGSAWDAEGRLSVRRTLLRVMLERPWFSSGDGEELAVLTAGSDDVAEAVQDRISRWGDDPVQGGGVRPPLAAGSVASSAEVVRDATLPGVAAALVMPSYDPSRNLWLADLRLTDPRGQSAEAAAAAPPIVQLALARYQRHALAGLHLSESVRTDPIALPPTRAILVQARDAGAQIEVDVWFFGRLPERAQVRAVVIIKEANLPEDDDMYWWPAKHIQPVSLRKLDISAPAVRIDGQEPSRYARMRFDRAALNERPARIRVEEWEGHWHEVSYPHPAAIEPASSGPSKLADARLVYVDVVDL